MAKLNTYVHVVEVDGEGRQGMFGPDDTLPEWAVRSIHNPKVWAEPPPAELDDSEREADSNAAAGRDTLAAGGSSAPERPRGNASRDTWVEFAGKLDPPVAVTDEMTRDDIVAAVDAREK